MNMQELVGSPVVPKNSAARGEQPHFAPDLCTSQNIPRCGIPRRAVSFTLSPRLSIGLAFLSACRASALFQLLFDAQGIGAGACSEFPLRMPEPDHHHYANYFLDYAMSWLRSHGITADIGDHRRMLGMVRYPVD